MSLQNGETNSSTEEKTHTDITLSFPLISNTDYTVATVNNPEIIPDIIGIPEIEIPILSGSISVSDTVSNSGPDSGIEGTEGGEGGSKKHLDIKAAIIAADALSLILDADSSSSPLSLSPSPSLPFLPLIISQHQGDALE